MQRSLSNNARERTKPYGTSKGERKAARKALSLAKASAKATTNGNTSLPYSNASAESLHWDMFYEHRASAAYRDRHVLRAIFPELMSASVALTPQKHIPPLSAPDAPTTPPDLTLLEAGCGHGSALFPVLRANPRLFAVAFDFSAAAVALLRAHEEHRDDRVDAFHADICDASTYVTRALVRGGAHFVTALWTLSALDCARVRVAVRGLVMATRVGALLFVRDFARGDMRETRLRAREGSLVERTDVAHVYRRGDGTVAAFFDGELLAQIFVDEGCDVVRSEVVEREVANRAKGLVMHRRWVQAVFRKK